MNLCLLAWLVVCFVGAWVPDVHPQGAFEDCCLAYHRHHHVARAVFRHAQGYRRQEVSGSCNLPAVIFFFPRRIKRLKTVCGNPQAKWVQDGMKHLDALNKKPQKIRHGARRTLRVSHSEVKKLSPEPSNLLASKLSNPGKSSKRNECLLPDCS